MKTIELSDARTFETGQRDAKPSGPSNVRQLRPSLLSSKQDDFPELETKRLLLREIRRPDAGEIFSIHGDPAVMRWFGNDPLPDVRAAERLIDFFANCRRSSTGTRWGIERKEDGRLLGTCGFYSWDRNLRRCNVGYELGSHAWGKGYMQEALEAAIPWAISHMQLNRIEAYIHRSNTPSINLAKSFGFVEEGVLRELEFWGGKYHDMHVFSLLARQYRGCRRSAGKEAKGRWLSGTVSRLARLLGGRD